MTEWLQAHKYNENNESSTKDQIHAYQSSDDATRIRNGTTFIRSRRVAVAATSTFAFHVTFHSKPIHLHDCN